MIKAKFLVGYHDALVNDLNTFYQALSEVKNAEVLDVQFCKRGNYELNVMITYEDGTGGPLKYRKPVQQPMPYQELDRLDVTREG